MSMPQFTPLPPSFVPDMRREVWGRFFGEGIEETRKSAGLSIERGRPPLRHGDQRVDGHRTRPCARGLEPAAGHGRGPGDPAIDQIALMALLCREAWEL